MQTTDSGLLFQTDQQIRHASQRLLKSAAANTLGHPITLPSKLLDLQVHGRTAWIAESGWLARSLDLITGNTERTYKGHRGPVTCLALHFVRSGSWTALITGSWDKSICIWNSTTGDLVGTLQGHTDFIKSLTVLPDAKAPLLVSTSSDRTFRLWDLSHLSSGTTPRCIQTCREHTRPVDCAGFRHDTDLDGAPTDTVRLWTADSMGIIKEWVLREGSAVFVQDLPGHETSVVRMMVANEGLWTASMDKMAIFHPWNDSKRTMIEHPSYVKSILPLPGTIYGKSLLLTGCEDETIRVWDVSDLPGGKAHLVSTVEGHCGEVSGLGIWRDGRSPFKVISVSLDNTLRRWTIEELLHPAPLVYEVLPDPGGVTLSAGEERELAELMTDVED